MSDNKKTIKVWLDESALTEEEYQELTRWEGEGGRATKPNEMALSVNTPIEPGQVLKVINGHLSFDDGVLYYNVEVEIQDES